MCRPEVFISGGSICGGDRVIFSCAFSTVMSSLKVMVTLRGFWFVAPSGGCMATMRGGVSSYGPPSGPLPGFAQAVSSARSRVSSERGWRCFKG